MSTPLAQILTDPRPDGRPDPRLERFVDQWAVALTTYKRDGTPVTKPVNIVVDGDRAFFRTYDKAWKHKRLRHDPRVEIAPATRRGRPTGPAIRARARLLEGAESERAGRLIDRKHPVFQRLFVRLGHRIRGYRTLHFEVTPDDRDSSPG
jgi:PPOX class probable F420-dependent enzyme